MRHIIAAFIALAAIGAPASSHAIDITPEISPDYLTCAEYRSTFNPACGDFSALCFSESPTCPAGFEPIAHDFFTTPVLPYCFPSVVPVCNVTGYYGGAQSWIVADCCAMDRQPVNTSCAMQSCPASGTECSAMSCFSWDSTCYVSPVNEGLTCGESSGVTCHSGGCY